jgi:predicted O-methyltransferase YrrM
MGQDKRSTPWPPATFTADLRHAPASLDAAVRLERALRHEDSLAFRLTKAVSAVPVLGPRLGARPGPRYRPIADRHAEVERITQAPLYRRIEGLRSSRVYERLWTRGVKRLRNRGAPPPTPAPAAPAQPAATPATLDPLMGRQVDEALAFLETIPFQELQRRGWHLQPNHFYWPLNDVVFLRDHPELWHDRGLPEGVDWDLNGQVEFARGLATYWSELAAIADRPAAVDMGSDITLVNGSFSGADACAYYGLARKLQPKRIVEVGAGWSSIFLAHALERNERPTAVTLVEPEPDRHLMRRLPREWAVRQSLLQLADTDVFAELEAGDICFYDGSHCVRTASDVNWFFFEVLPRLAPGVMVHVHDIFLPDDYHDQWLFGDGLSWNEQYLLQAFLMHNSAYRVRLANHMLFRLREADVRPLHPGWHDGGSVWLEKVAL